MALTRPDSRQVINRAALAKLGAAANTTQDSINSKVNLEVDSPLRLAASFPTPDAQLNFSNSLLTAADGANKVLPPISSQVFESLSGAFINFQTQALSNAAHFIITFPSSTVGQFRRAGFTLTSAGKIQVVFSAEAASEGALANPGTVFVTGIPLGYVNLVGTVTSGTGAFKTAGSATNIIENAKIYRFGTGGGAGSSGSGSGLGDDLNSLNFRASFSDDFSDIPSASTSAIDTTRTNATYDAVAAAYRMSYDASRTITGTGTAMTLSGAPAFTVAAGDVVVNLSTLEVRRIASISSQTSYTLESAFASDPTAVAVCVSQAVHTNDVRAHTENSTGLAISAVISDSVSSYMLRYRDSAAASDAIWDFPGSALVAFSASADNSNWSAAQTRVTALSTTEPVRSVPVSGSQFRARFFANATSGTGAVNVLDYKVFLHQDSNSQSGVISNKALARTDGAGTEVNCSVSSDTGKTRVTTTFAFGTEVQVYLDGKKIPEFVDALITPDAYFTRISGNVLELDSDYSGLGLQVEVLVPANTVDNTNQNAANIAALQDMMAVNSFQGMVSEASLLSAVNGAPGAGQFRTFGIQNRASIPDIQNDLRVRMGIDRVQVQQVYELQGEFGPNGERVSAVLNDDRNLIRIVGAPTNTIDSHSVHVVMAANDFAEVVFYGTGLNLLQSASSASRDIRLTVDGGAESGNLYTTTSDVLDARNYPVNQVLPLVSGLSLGLHTAKIRVVSTNLRLYGFEILNESANVNVRPGVAFVGGKKLVLSAASSVAYNSGFETVTREGAAVAFSSTRGARVIEYLKADGTKGKSAYLTNSTQGNLGSADHTYEDIIRRFNFREFGAGRTDDFSRFGGGANVDQGFILDDGTTTLAGEDVQQVIVNGKDHLTTNGAVGTGVILTFVGTGCDLFSDGTGANGTIAIYVDGVSVGNVTQTNGLKRIPIVSGLPYGTHTIRIERNGNQANLADFIVYGPKKPTLPSGAVELADYCVMADYSNTTATGTSFISHNQKPTGVLSKLNLREMTYVGSWSIDQSSNAIQTPPGFRIVSSTNNDYVEYTFFGTGVVLHLQRNNGGNIDFAIRIDGALNASGVNTNPSTITNLGGGSYRLLTDASSGPARLEFTGLSLAKHTVRLTNTVTSAFNMNIIAMDLITPIHALKSQLPGDLQNTLLVGSQGISDSRRLSLIKSEDPKKFRGVAQGITSGPSTSSGGYVPVPDLSLIVPSKGAWFDIKAMVSLGGNGSGNTFMAIFVDGVQVGKDTGVGTTGSSISVENNQSVFLAAGVHKIDAYWKVSTGTTTAFADYRNLTVNEQ